MLGDLTYIIVLVVLYLVLRSPFGLRALVGLLGKRGLKAVGRLSPSQQPDNISFATAGGAPRPQAASVADALERRGFTNAGRFSIPEMKRVHVTFLVKPEEAAVGVVYEHAQAGVWCDLHSSHMNDASFTVTSARAGSALDEPPGHINVRQPGAPPAVLHVRLMRERPAGELLPIGADRVAQHFADAYARSMAWRKKKGLTAREVRGAALEKIRA